MNVTAQTGRLTRDPEFNSGSRADGGEWTNVRFSIAVDKPLSKHQQEAAKQQGEPTAHFFDVTSFEPKTVAFMKDQFEKGFMTKGKLVEVMGSLAQRKYTNKDSVLVNVVEIVADKVGYGPVSVVNNNGENAQNGHNAQNGQGNGARQNGGTPQSAAQQTAPRESSPQMEPANAPTAAAGAAAPGTPGAWNPFAAANG
jgi:single-stranded DNA-binding protein